MKTTQRGPRRLAGALVCAALGMGCAEAPPTTAPQGDAGVDAASASGQGGGAATVGAGGGDGQGGAGAGDGTGGGVVAQAGPGASEWVAAGGVAASSKYKLVFSLGQATTNQGKSASSSYRLQGGLSGANGSLQ
jgi:hypothetical protein